MRVFENVGEIIGNTPLVKLNKLSLGLKAEIVAKLEFLNPSGSIKDRTALGLLLSAEEKGLISKGATVIEASSGNTGIALAMLCATRNYSLILIMPEGIREEKKRLLKFLGARLVFTSTMQEAREKAKEISKQIPNSFFSAQFENSANSQIHKSTTAQEIWRDTEGKVDIIVAGVGTGGTISGLAQGLKEKKKEIKIVAVEPATFPHKIEGIGAGFTPPLLQKELVDEIVKVEEKDAFLMMRRLAQEEGILAGVSSGAIVWASVEVGKVEKGKLIVAILPDGAQRYLSI
ncbi:MAG: cysteine synthase A [Candidatus Omnitrophota bacterium]|nr:MAG: cysteine synthase A [Candidatus Omnitrophota bacterium]